MTRSTEQRPPEVSWLLQIQYRAGEPWHDHTGELFSREDAQALMAERQAAYPKQAYRLVRVTTTYTLEPS